MFSSAPAPTAGLSIIKSASEPIFHAGSHAARQPPFRTRHLATMERLSSPKPRGDQDEVLQSSRREDRLARFRAPGRRASHPRRGAQPLHRPRHARHAARGMSLSGERGGSHFRRVAQQSHQHDVNVTAPRRNIPYNVTRAENSKDTPTSLGSLRFQNHR